MNSSTTDTWAATDRDGEEIRRQLMRHLVPKKEHPDEVALDRLRKESKESIAIHNRRIALNMATLKAWRASQQPERTTGQD